MYKDMARAMITLGRIEEARSYAERALRIVRDVGMTFVGPEVLVACAATADDAAQRKAFLEEGETILDQGCASHNHIWFSRAAIDIALSEGDWGAAERYAARLETYTKEEPLPWCDFIIERGRTLAAWGRGDRSQQQIDELRRLKALAEKVGLRLALPAIEKALAA